MTARTNATASRGGRLLAVKTLLSMLMVLCAVMPAQAQFRTDVAVPGVGAMPAVPRQALLQGLALPHADDGGKPRMLRAPVKATMTAGRADGARALAGMYPRAQQAEAARVFAQLLDAFGQLEAKLGLPSGDLANATALYVIGAFEASRDVSVDPAAYMPVIEQLRAALAASAPLAAAAAADKRVAYEQLAIAGMLVVATRARLAQQPDARLAQQLREAGRQYLAQLGLDADALVIDDRGLALRGAPAQAAPANAATDKPATDTASAYLAPGKGLAASAVEGVLYSWAQTYTVGGLQMEEHLFVLLKDGRVRSGAPPVALDDFDAAAEQRAEPAKWGAWKKRGGQYVVKLERDKDFHAPPGQLLRSPGGRDERLDGTFEGASSYAIPGGAASWSKWSLTLRRDGRFERSHSGGVGGSAGVGDAQIVAANRWDDEGSVSAVSGANVGGGSTRRSGATKADRQGSYRIDGYALELRYDNGRVERRFFATNEKRSAIWFGDGELSRRKR